CIATYQRRESLAAVLEDLLHQEAMPHQVVVVDNDASGSARTIVDRYRAFVPPFRVDYDIQPRRNIALTRNRTVALAVGDWLACVDDDERAPSTWLRQLLEAAARYQADAVLGPVEPEVPEWAPGWIRRGRFYDFPRLRTGTQVPLNRMRLGNALFNGMCLRAE